MISKKTGQKMWVVVTCMVSLFAFSGCAGTDKGKTAAAPAALAENSLRIGVAPSAPPLIFYQEGRSPGSRLILQMRLRSHLEKLPDLWCWHGMI